MEYNFFEAVMEQKRKTSVVRLAMMAVVIIVFGYLIVGVGVNLIQFYNLNNDIKALSYQAEQNTYHMKLLNAAQEEIRYLEGKFDYLYRADFLARNSRVVTVELIEVLPSLAPAYLSLNAVSVSGRDIRMSGITPDIETLAQFEHNIRNSDIFYNPIIRSANLINAAAIEEGQEIVGPYRFSADARIRWDANHFDLIFDKAQGIVLRATDPDYLWDTVLKAIAESEIEQLTSYEYDEYEQTDNNDYAPIPAAIGMGEAFTYKIDENSADGRMFIENIINQAYRAGGLEREVRHRSLAANNTSIQAIPPGRARISSPFGFRINPVTEELEFHNGVDMAFAYATPIVAIQKAVITSIGYNDISGHFIRYRTTEGLVVGYAHLAQVLVQVGDIVEQGDVVALTGNSGRSTGPHLHVSTWRNGILVDPLTVFSVLH